MKIEENMKKTLSLVLFLAFLSYQSQYLIIGKDSISVDKFKTENKDHEKKFFIFGCNFRSY